MLNSQDEESDWSDICQVSTCLDQGVIGGSGATYYSEGSRTSHVNSSSFLRQNGNPSEMDSPPKKVSATGRRVRPSGLV